MALSIHSAEKFAIYIEHRVRDKKMGYMEAVLDFCEKRQLEPEAILPYINDKIKSAIGEEAQKLHMIAFKARLPL